MLLLVGLLTTVSALAQDVYVESNIGRTPNQNSVFAYSTDARGFLTTISGSPFRTGGTGVFNSNPLQSPGFASDQEVVINAAGTQLFAVNGDTNTISTFSVNSDGTLALLGNVNSGGVDPVSIGLDELSPAGSQLTVVNQAEDPNQTGGIPNITSFLVDSSGTLTPVASSTINLPGQSVPFQALPSPGGKFLFTVESNVGGAMSSYTIGTGGKFVSNNSVLPTLGPRFMGMAVHPKQRVLYVAVPDSHLIEIYTYNKQGDLAFYGSVNNPGEGVGWLAVGPGGGRLYSAEPGSNSVTVYDLSGAKYLAPQQLQHLTLKSGGSATHIKVPASARLLYVLGLDQTGTAGSYLHVLNISTQGVGKVAENTDPVLIPEPAGEIPQGLALK
jgi:6-phosphogluconolactonase (cycloisomerase 2 family)